MYNFRAELQGSGRRSEVGNTVADIFAIFFAIEPGPWPIIVV